MYKLIALDMDGTLLNSQKQISERTKAAIARARENGIRIVLASGRPINGIRSKLEELNIRSERDFVVSFNGSLVQNVATGAILHNEIIDGKSARLVAGLARELGVCTHAFSQEFGLITPENNKYTEHEAEINSMPVTEMDFSLLEDDHPIIKTMIVAEPELLTRAIRQFPASFHEQFTIVQSTPFFVEFLNKKSNKGLAVQAIAEHLGIKKEEVICMGDAENDHHMIEYAGLGVAMANAMEETKKIADYITHSNDEDGVAYVIEKFALEPVLS